MYVSGKRLSALEFARALQGKSDAELEQIALAHAPDERTLWAVLAALGDRRGKGALTLKKQIRDRLILKKPLPMRLRGGVWTTAVQPSSKRAWYSTLAYVGLALNKEVHAYTELDTLRRLLPLQGGMAASNIASVCREILRESLPVAARASQLAAAAAAGARVNGQPDHLQIQTPQTSSGSVAA